MRSDAAIIIERSFRRLIRRRADAPADLVDRLRKNPDAVVDEAATIKDGDRCTVRRLDTESGPLVIKRYNRRGLLHSIPHAVARSRAAWCWRNAQALLVQGVRTPRPRVMVEERWGPFRGRSFLVTDFIEGQPLLDVVRSADEGRIGELAERFADIWSALGRLRAGHGDMKATNFIVDPSDEIWLVDLDALRFYPPILFRRERAKDRERFLRNWRFDAPGAPAAPGDPGAPGAAETEAVFRARLDRA